MPVLTVDQVTKQYDKILAVNKASFSAGPGRILGLLGPNGAGKTTTIRMITYITVPDSGEILFGDRKVGPWSQERMGVTLWEDRDAYLKNSPVMDFDQLDTPLLMAVGSDDGNVDWHQGIEAYNFARRLDKDFVFLVYRGENHSNRQKPNQVDYHHRQLEWFGHYLKGEPAPDWITEGLSWIDQEKGRAKK